MKKILFLCQFFYPEYISSAALPFDTAVYLAKSGFDVSALCGYPKEYNDLKNVPKKEKVKNVTIQRVSYLQLKRSSFLGRIINYFSFTLSVFRFFPKFRNYDLLISYSNPPILPLLPVLSKILFKNKFVFISYDVYPEIAIQTKSVEPKSFICLFMKFVNFLVFKYSDRVVAISEDMARFFLKNRRLKKLNQVVVIHNWFEEDLESISLVQSVKSKSFNVSYFGNMGICQEFDTLFVCIERLKDDPSIYFNFAGHGNKYNYLENLARCKNLQNVHFLGYLKGHEYLRELKNSDLFFISLEKGLNGLASPSKLYSYYLFGKPIIAVLDKKSIMGQEIQYTQGIGVVSHGDVDGIINAIRIFKNNPEMRRDIEKKNRNLFQKYTRDKAMKKYHQMIYSLFY